MANGGRGREDETKKSFGERFKDYALGPRGLGSLYAEVSYAIADFRHKFIEEGWYGRAVTPRWEQPKSSPADAPNIHGSNQTKTPDDAGGVHGKAKEAPSPDLNGGVHGKAEPATVEPETVRFPAEETGLGMSYAELEASWMQEDTAALAVAGHERERSHEPDQSIEP